MASNIKFKRSAVQNRVPTTAQLDLGELALNTYDGKLYTEINTGSAAVVEIGSKLSSLVVDGDNGAGGGDVTFHGQTAGRDVTWDYSANRLEFADNAIASFGDNADLRIYHTGSHSYISDFVTGDLRLTSDSLKIKNNLDNETMAVFDADGAVDLYHNNLLRISTTADGADISGTGSLKVPVGTTAQRSASPTNGDLRYNTTTGGFEGYSNNNWGELGAGGIGIGSTSTNPASGVVANRIGVGFTDINVVGSGISVTGYGSTIVLDFNDFKPGSFHRTIHNYTATAGQTTFAGLNYVASEKQIAVYLNGARLSEATYTATSGTTVVLDVGASLGDEVEIINIHTNSDVDRKVNTYTATAGQTTFTGLSYNSKTELDVYLNGIRLASDDFTATSGNTVVLAVGASVNDTVDIVSTGDGVTWRSTTDASGDVYKLTNVGIGTDQTPDKLNVTGTANFNNIIASGVTTSIGKFHIRPSNGQLTPKISYDDSIADALIFGDNVQARFGTSSDLKIYHDGSQSVIKDDGTGQLLISGENTIALTNAAATENYARFLKDGQVELFYNNTKRFETTNTGSKVTGNLEVTGVLTYDDVTNIDSVGIITARAGLFAPDNASLKLGNTAASPDLEIVHNSSENHFNVSKNTFFKGNVAWGVRNASNQGVIEALTTNRTVNLYGGTLKVLSTTGVGVTVRQGFHIEDAEFNMTTNGSKILDFETGGSNFVNFRHNPSNGSITTFIKATHGGSVELYHDSTGVKKFETTSNGVNVTGRIFCDGTAANSRGLIFNDDVKISLGSNNDLEIYHDGSHSYIDDVGTGNLKLRSNNFRLSNADESKLSATFVPSGAVELYHNNVKTFFTTSAGIQVQGASGGIGQITLSADANEDNADKFKLVVEDNGPFKIQNRASGSWETNIECNGNGNVELYHNNSKKFETTSSGATVSGQLTAGTSGGQNPSQTSWATNSALNLYGSYGGGIAFNDNGNNGFVQYVESAGVIFNLKAGAVGGSLEQVIRAVKDGQVELYYNNSKKIETTNTGAVITGICTATSFSGSGANITNVNADTVDGIQGGSFLRGDVDDTTVGHLTFNRSNDAKFSLSGTNNPFFIFNEGTTQKARIQWSESGYLWLQNHEDDSVIVLRDNIGFSPDAGSTIHKIFHAGNDGSGSGLDADTLDGAQGSQFLRSDSTDTCSGQITFTNQIISRKNGDRSTQGGNALILTHATTPALRANHFIHDDFPSGSGTYYIQVTESGVTNDRNMCLQGYGGKLGVGMISEPTATLHVTGTFRTTSTSTFNGDATFSGGAGAVTVAAASDIRIAGGTWTGEYTGGIKIQSDGSNSYIQHKGTLFFRDEGSTNNFQLTQSGGLTITGAITANGGFSGAHSITGTLTTRDVLLNSGYHLMRSNHHSGHLEGSYNNVGENSTKSNPIYTIGSSYNPNDNTLSDMYGIGYTHTNASFINSNIPSSGQSWGLYVAANGVSRIFLSGNSGSIWPTGRYGRLNHHTGFLEGSYNNVGANTTKSNPIYTIGSSYNPTESALSNMYGIGFTHANSSFISFTGASAWGLYVAADGDARVWLDGSNGVVSSTGQHYVGSNVVWNAGNDGSGSGLDADTLDGVQGAAYLRSNTADTASGDITFSGGGGAVTVAAASDIRFTSGTWTGNTTQPKIQAHSDYLYLVGGPNGIIFREGGTDRARFDGDGHFRPATNNTYDCGTSGNRWRNIYTNDLNLSNEGGANDVDGTWGNFTIQEGEDDLFLINKRNGKKYKFNLTEVQ